MTQTQMGYGRKRNCNLTAANAALEALRATGWKRNARKWRRLDRLRGELVAKRLGRPPTFIPFPAGIAIADLTGCRFPDGDPRAIGFHFCNRDRISGSSYCKDHRGMCILQGG
jgi:hypothetical protein